MIKLFGEIYEKYLTWKTGDDKIMRNWKKWSEENIVLNARTVQNMFVNFKHIMVVDPEKIFDYGSPHPGWNVTDDFAEYEYPAKPLGENAVWVFERGVWDYFHKEFSINGMGDIDLVFVATNNDEDAVMIALKYS
jgi:hypothetical protein